MKTTKRALSTLLALALVFGLALPAGAAAPIITELSPEWPVARIGEKMTLTVGVEQPEGAQGELEFQWYQIIDDDWVEIEGAVSNSLTVTATLGDIDSLPVIVREYVLVIYYDGGAIYQTVTVGFVPGLLDSFRFAFRLVDVFIDGTDPADMGFEIADTMLRFFIKAIFAPMLFLSALSFYFSGNALYYGRT